MLRVLLLQCARILMRNLVPLNYHTKQLMKNLEKRILSTISQLNQIMSECNPNFDTTVIQNELKKDRLRMNTQRLFIVLRKNKQANQAALK